MAVHAWGMAVWGAQRLEGVVSLVVVYAPRRFRAVGVRVVLSGVVHAAVYAPVLVVQLALLCDTHVFSHPYRPALPFPLSRERPVAPFHFAQQPGAGLDALELPSDAKLALDLGNIRKLIDEDMNLEENMTGEK